MPYITKTQRAEQDLDEIWLHIALDNPDAADEVLDAIGHTCMLLAEQPKMGRARPELALELRSFPVARSYLVYYRPVADGIQIARVLHGARDIDVMAQHEGFDE